MPSQPAFTPPAHLAVRRSTAVTHNRDGRPSRPSDARSSSTHKQARRPRPRAAPSMTVHPIRGPRDLQAHLPTGPRGAAASAAATTTAPLVVLSFVTPGCRACAYARAAFARLAREFVPAGSRAVRFCEMDVSTAATRPLGQSLGVNAVPAFQLYALKDGAQGGEGADATPAFGVLDELAGARVVGEIRKRLALYSSDGFDLDEYVFEE